MKEFNKGFNLQGMLMTGVTVALGLVIYHMVNKHLLTKV